MKCIKIHNSDSENGEMVWTDDLHLLPFYGVDNWEYNMKRISKCGYDGILTFELTRESKPNRHENDRYMNMSIEEYLSEAFQRAYQVASIFERYKL